MLLSWVWASWAPRTSSAWRQCAGRDSAAVMSSDERKLAGDLTAIEGNLGNSGEQLDFSQVTQTPHRRGRARRPGNRRRRHLSAHRPSRRGGAGRPAGRQTRAGRKPIALSNSEAAAVIRRGGDQRAHPHGGPGLALRPCLRGARRIAAGKPAPCVPRSSAGVAPRRPGAAGSPTPPAAAAASSIC